MKNARIVVVQSGGSYLASLKDCPEVWGVGKTANEAIGQMVCYHAGMFNVSVRIDRETPKTVEQENSGVSKVT